ncbi:MAG: aminotransferase class V-fold PLP-dependent enzyme [Pseudomonadales bacterium]|nr:aminotransferase class V-fold PLP-dependent enzyme [Pseudomonadales bacterium]
MLDIGFVRSMFPAYRSGEVTGHAFDAAAGSFPCQQTVDALHHFYSHLKVQPANPYAMSEQAWQQMEASHQRWAEALGVKTTEIGFGPSTSQNTYVLAQAFRQILQPGDEVIVTNQDHESNTGAIRRAVLEAGATLREWQVDSTLGLLDMADLESLLNSNTRLVCFPHSSNIAGTRNDVKAITRLIHDAGALSMVDGVSYAPHEIPDLGDLGCDIYVFSLYKVFSVHQGILMVKEAVLEQLPPQYHHFKQELNVQDRLIVAGPDHAQIAASGAVFDYISALATHHGISGDLPAVVRQVSDLWHAQEQTLVQRFTDWVATRNDIRLLGSPMATAERCPLFAMDLQAHDPWNFCQTLCADDIWCTAGHCYAPRILEAVGVDPARGVLRFSLAHYNDLQDIDAAIAAMEKAL